MSPRSQALKIDLMSENDTQEVLDQDANDQVEETASEETQEETQETVSEDSDSQEPDSQETKESEEETSPVEPRKVYSMPVAKAQKEKERAVQRAIEEKQKEHEERIEQMRSEFEAKLRSSTSPDAHLEEISKKFDLEPEAVKELVGAIKSTIKVPDMSRYEQILQEREVEGHKQSVSKEFDEKIAPMVLKDHPQASPEFIREVKGKIEELAFTEGYNTYRLEDIYKVKRDEFVFKNEFSAESSGGRNSEVVSFTKLSDEEENELAKNDPETYKKYVAWDVGQESKFIY